MEEFLKFVETQKQVTRNRNSTNSIVENVAKLLEANITHLLKDHHAIYQISPDPLEYGKVFINKAVYQIVDTENKKALLIYNLYN